jgi:hypothetical protein
MKTRWNWTSAAIAVGSVGLTLPGTVLAQDAGSAFPARSRSVDERVTTEAPTPRPINAAQIEATQGVAVPVVPGNPAGAMDPAARFAAGAYQGGASGRGAFPAGMIMAFLAEHSLEMAIDAATLGDVLDASSMNNLAPTDPQVQVVDHVRWMRTQSKWLMSRAVNEAAGLEPNAPIRRFLDRANDYLRNLEALTSAPEQPVTKARIGLVNHAVKTVLDADHILQMTGGTGSGLAEPLVAHAREMRERGTRTLAQLAAKGPEGDPAPADMVAFAVKGQALIEASRAVFVMPRAAQTGLNTAPLTTPGGYPGRFQNNRPEIIGGSDATGSPSLGTSSNAGSKPIVDPGEATGSSGGLKPR